MAIFNSYVSLLEGNYEYGFCELNDLMGNKLNKLGCMVVPWFFFAMGFRKSSMVVFMVL